MIWISNNHKPDEQEILIRYLRVIQHRCGSSTVCRRFSCGNYDKLCNFGFWHLFVCLLWVPNWNAGYLSDWPRVLLGKVHVRFSGWIQVPPSRIKLVSSIMVYFAIYIYKHSISNVPWFSHFPGAKVSGQRHKRSQTSLKGVPPWRGQVTSDREDHSPANAEASPTVVHPEIYVLL